MKYCANCGKAMEDNVAFCPECGAAQQAAPQAEARPVLPGLNKPKAVEASVSEKEIRIPGFLQKRK